MTELFLTILEVSASVSVVIALLLLISPLLNRRYASKWMYLVWIFLAVRLVLPFSGADGVSAADRLLQWKNYIAPDARQEASGGEVAPQVPRRVVVEIPAQMAEPLAMQTEKNITILDICAVLWAAGCLVFIAVHLMSYAHYKRRVLQYGTVVKDVFMLQEFLRTKRELHIRCSVPIILFPGAASPMIMGFLRPVLILPESDYSEKELHFILKHELVHLKRGDVCFKFLFMLAGGVHWFNPLVWLLQREAVVDMELSCDEKVTQGADFAVKKAYTETLLATLHKGCARSTSLSTGFYGGKQIMKKRFRNILRKTGKKNGCYVLACVIILTITAGTLVGCSVGKREEENISEGESAAAAENLSEETLFERMAGSWLIDFDRTDQTLWGTGISYGDSMDISAAGQFSYYIGIGVGGTGQCEENDGVITVEITPYEEHSSEQEVLTLTYRNENGAEYILMDWYGEDVYWVRNVSVGSAAAGEDDAAGGLKDGIMLSIVKEGETEEKWAVPVVEGRYALYLPEGEWEKEEADTWRAVVNENVRIQVANFEKDYPIEQILTDDGYVPDEEGLTKEENGIRYHGRFYEAGEDIWYVYYSYPTEAEEGWGRELSVIADTFAAVEPNEYFTDTMAVSAQILGYVTGIGDGTVTIDRQDWVTPDSENWKPEYDAEAGFEVVDLEGADVTYPVRDDCKYFILENHQGESLEVDAGAFERYIQETDFPIFWGVEVEDGEVINFAEWYRP